VEQIRRAFSRTKICGCGTASSTVVRLNVRGKATRALQKHFHNTTKTCRKYSAR
jgi:galactitol-specific phosphotransferase system IIB component